MTRHDQPVVIAGGGIGGLSTALALAKNGIASRVLEKRPEFSEAGAGIQLGPNAIKILQRLGAAEALAPFAATPDAIVVHDGVNGRELTELPLGEWIAQRHGAPYWTVHRQDLHASLRQTAELNPRITLQTGAEVTGFENAADGVAAILADGSHISGPALVAADGLWSKLRTQVTPSGPLTPAGKCAYRGVVPGGCLPGELSADSVHIWLSPGAHVVHYPVRQGRETALVAVLDDPTRGDSWSLPAPDNWVTERAGTFPDLLKALLTRVAGWRMWSLQKLPRLDKWNQDRVALLGDAAHPVLPFLAQGGVLAIEDADVLAKCLKSGNGDVASALATYSRLRQPRAARVADASQRNGQIYHMSGPMAFARNTVLRAAPPSQLMAGYDWLYGFTT